MSDADLAHRAWRPLGRLLNVKGRTAPGDFWPYMGLLFAIYVVGFVLVFPGRPFFGILPGVPAMFALTLILILLACAAVIRRLHDVGWSGWWMAAYTILASAFIIFVVRLRYVITHQPFDPSSDLLFRLFPILAIFMLITNCIGLLILVVCVLPGTAGPNKYGPDPKNGTSL